MTDAILTCSVKRVGLRLFQPWCSCGWGMESVPDFRVAVLCSEGHLFHEHRDLLYLEGDSPKGGEGMSHP